MKPHSLFPVLMLIIFSFVVGFFAVKLRPSQVKTTFTAGSLETFNYLANTQSSTGSSCGLQPQTIDGFDNDSLIAGACCGAMDFHRYQGQVEGLKKYSGISQVPEDPYNVPVSLAKELFGYQASIILTDDQQTLYDQAMEMSHEGGPCCCKCWRWTAFEGLAKYLITQKGFDGQQVAEIWDLEDGCGGSRHEHNS
jgi:hypothetical protein